MAGPKVYVLGGVGVPPGWPMEEPHARQTDLAVCAKTKAEAFERINAVMPGAGSDANWRWSGVLVQGEDWLQSYSRGALAPVVENPGAVYYRPSRYLRGFEPVPSRG